MCFSASASFTGAVVLLVAGAAAQRLARRPAERVFAAIPLLFAAQQATEGLIWLSFGWGEPAITAPLAQLYSFFSHVLWPVFVPIAAWLIEPATGRRRTLAGFTIAGLVVGVFLLYSMLANPIEARPVGGHIEYVSPHFYVVVVMLLYLAATTVSLLVTSLPMVRLFGALALGAFVASYVAYARWFISVWCFFAALLSVVVCLHLAAARGRLPGFAAGGARGPLA